MGKILVIDLSSAKTEEIQISREILTKLIGGRGLGAYLLYKMLPPNVDPLSDENLLIIANGPLNGTRMPLASKVGIYFKSPLTGIFGESYVGGSLPRFPKCIGYDAVVFRGRAPKPTYVVISDDGVEFRNALELWGKGVVETDNVLRKEFGKNATIVTIGPAGENLVRFAAICVDKWRQAGRCGGGAVMGSKNLKAAVFLSDTPYVSPARDNEFQDVISELIMRIRKSRAVSQMRRLGTSGMVYTANKMGFFPTRYWSSGFMDGWENIGPDAVQKILVYPHPCWNCPIACGRYVKVKTKWGTIEMDGVDYEVLFSLGGLIGVNKIENVVYLNYLADDLGLDAISLGNVIGFAIEAAKRGKVKVEIDYSDADSIVKLIMDIAYRRNIGRILADGVARAAKELNLEEIAVHVKGLEPPGYDPRVLKGMILAYATSPRGACHLRMMAYYVDLAGLAGEPHEVTERKARKLIEFENFMTAFDSLILCKFGRSVVDFEIMLRAFNAAIGVDFSMSEFVEALERILAIIRLFNYREGIRKKHETLPTRFISDKIVDSKGKVHEIKQEEIDFFLNTYYRLRNYNEDGIPTENVKRKLLGGIIE